MCELAYAPTVCLVACKENRSIECSDRGVGSVRVVGHGPPTNLPEKLNLHRESKKTDARRDTELLAVTSPCQITLDTCYVYATDRVVVLT